MNQRFYDALSDYYHLVFDDWDAAIRRQGEVLARLLPLPNDAGPVLDVACGIGTQSIALAQLGYRIEGSDISSREVQRANREASARGLQCVFRVDDMRTLMSAPVGKFGAVIAMDNALPHLDSDDEIVAAMKAMRRCLLPGGRALISIRDYARALAERPTFQAPSFFGVAGARRIYFQVWDWIDTRRYAVHLHLNVERPEGWIAHHFVGRYRAVTLEEMVDLANRAGYRRVEIIPSSSTGYQPIIVAHA